LQTIESDIKVAVMGCAVNGPGEAKEADIGIAGRNKRRITFQKRRSYKKSTTRKNSRSFEKRNIRYDIKVY